MNFWALWLEPDSKLTRLISSLKRSFSLSLSWLRVICTPQAWFLHTANLCSSHSLITLLSESWSCTYNTLWYKMAHSWPKLYNTHIPTHMYINTTPMTYISCPLESARYVTSIRTEMPPTFASYSSSYLISSTYSCNNPWPWFPHEHVAGLTLKFSASLHKWIRWSVTVSPIGDLSKVPGLDLAQTYWLALTWSSLHTRATFIFIDNHACAITPWSKAGWILQQVFSLLSA